MTGFDRLASGPVPAILYHLERVVLADGEPVGLDSAWLPRELGERLRPEITHEFIMPLLVRHRIRIDHVDFQFEGATVSDREASLLALPVGFPLLVVDYTAFAPGGTPILTGRTASRADRFTYEFCARPELHRVPPPGGRGSTMLSLEDRASRRR